MVFIALVVFCMILTGCGNQASPDSGVVEIDFYNNQQSELSIRDMGYRAEVLRLQLPSDTMVVGTVASMAVSDSVIYLLELPEKSYILAFDSKTGKYKCGYYNLGRGPGEFLMTLGIEWDGEYLRLKDMGKRALMFYDADLNFVKQRALPPGEEGIAIDMNDGGIWHKPIPDSALFYNLAKMDTLGNVSVRLLPEQRDLNNPSGSIRFHLTGQNFVSNGRDLYYLKTMKTTLYRVKNDTAIPAYKMNLGPNALPEDYDFVNRSPMSEGKRVPMVLVMSNDHLLAQIMDFGKDERVWGSYNLKTGKSVIGNVVDESGIPFYVKTSHNGVLYYPYTIYPGMPDFEKFCIGAEIDPETVPDDGETVILKYIPIE